VGAAAWTSVAAAVSAIGVWLFYVFILVLPWTFRCKRPMSFYAFAGCEERLPTGPFPHQKRGYGLSGVRRSKRMSRNSSASLKLFV